MQRVEILQSVQWFGDNTSVEFDRPTMPVNTLAVLFMTQHNVGVVPDNYVASKVQHTFSANPAEEDWLDLIGFPPAAGHLGSNLFNSVRIDVSQLGPKMRLVVSAESENAKGAADVVIVRDRV